MPIAVSVNEPKVSVKSGAMLKITIVTIMDTVNRIKKADVIAFKIKPVSYTHLTLPTKRIV